MPTSSERWVTFATSPTTRDGGKRVVFMRRFLHTEAHHHSSRSSYYTLGALMLFLSAVRFFVLPMDESAKFLVS
jgi:hypothetical protein